MCAPFSCIVMRNGSVKTSKSAYVHSHSAILVEHEIRDDRPYSGMLTVPFAKIEMLGPHRCVKASDEQIRRNIKVDESIIPCWYSERHVVAVVGAYRRWIRRVRRRHLIPLTTEDFSWFRDGKEITFSLSRFAKGTVAICRPTKWMARVCDLPRAAIEDIAAVPLHGEMLGMTRDLIKEAKAIVERKKSRKRTKKPARKGGH